ncbi:phenazine antibiotic biosynthesis protein [Streptomyces triticagri]|uniref:Phenazine antibiotic biosynthesis protein n=1 Tax=Streptomyces triticagri TaxID=2293568 RepID=A0A372M754_9ACTN|nr:phenazine antibiotic biosynthesis protein [Streptomyces triticagri]RFU86788.1 phenazine antibiotic biosynthesis protein [Streptomyces triticagri]
MTLNGTEILNPPPGVRPDPDQFVRAAMQWHFSPETGSPYWLHRAGSLGFDPRTDVRTHADLALFPNVAGELRDVPAQDLIPRGYGSRPDVVGVYESGGTTGAPKRVVLLRDWLDRMLAWSNEQLDAHGFPRGLNWLGTVPSGPHIVGEYFRRSAATHGTHGFTVDLDPRWVKRLIAEGRGKEAGAYAEHIVDQAAEVLRSQDIGVLTITPPLLERLAARDELVELVNKKVRAIRWGGTQLDPDTRDLYRDEIFPDTVFSGNYGSTMILGFAGERPGLGPDDPCVFDTLSPFVTFEVVDPEADGTDGTGGAYGINEPVPYGSRGRVVAHHVSASFLLPNNLERDTAIRVPALGEGPGDAVADIAPVTEFENETVIEGVY